MRRTSSGAQLLALQTNPASTEAPSSPRRHFGPALWTLALLLILLGPVGGRADELPDLAFASSQVLFGSQELGVAGTFYNFSTIKSGDQYYIYAQTGWDTAGCPPPKSRDQILVFQSDNPAGPFLPKAYPGNDPINDPITAAQMRASAVTPCGDYQVWGLGDVLAMDDSSGERWLLTFGLGDNDDFHKFQLLLAEGNGPSLTSPIIPFADSEALNDILIDPVPYRVDFDTVGMLFRFADSTGTSASNFRQGHLLIHFATAGSQLDLGSFSVEVLGADGVYHTLPADRRITFEMGNINQNTLNVNRVLEIDGDWVALYDRTATPPGSNSACPNIPTSNGGSGISYRKLFFDANGHFMNWDTNANVKDIQSADAFSPLPRNGFFGVITPSLLIDDGTYHLYWSQDNECLSATNPFNNLDAMHTVLQNEIGELGKETSLTHEAKTVLLSRAYDNPVVFAQPLSANGSATSVVRITDVSADRFTFFVHEAPDRDGIHTNPETVSWLVLEAGSWKLADGSRLEVGKLNTSATVGKGVANQWTQVAFGTPLTSVPVVLTQVQSNGDATWVKTRQRSATTSGFEVAMEEAEAGDAHGSETVGWLAIEPTTSPWSGHPFVAANTPDAVNHAGYTTSFGVDLGSDPHYVASLATYDGADAAALRYSNLSATGVVVAIEEDTTYDSELGHTPEIVSYLALGGAGILTANPFLAPVDTPPVSNFTFSCSGLTCSFDGGSSTDDEPIPSGGYAWSFGDSTGGSGRTTSHTYGSGGTYNVTLTVTDGAGQPNSKTLQVTVSNASPACAGLIQEAEDGALTGFSVLNDSSASGGDYIVVPNGSGNRGAPNQGFKAEYCFSVPTTGIYRIKGWIRSPSFGDDSFFVKVDGAPSAGNLWVTQVSASGSFQEDYINNYNVEDPLEVSLTAGDHMVTIFQREDGTELDKLQLELQLPPSCGPLAQEAEDGTLIGFTTLNDSNASNGSYIVVPNGSGNQGAPNESFKATYCFGIATAGTYRIRAWTRSPSFGDDSFFVKVDGAPSAGHNWVTPVSPSSLFQDDYVNDFNIADPVEVFLSPGNHTLTIYQREDGTQLDRLLIELQ